MLQQVRDTRCLWWEGSTRLEGNPKTENLIGHIDCELQKKWETKVKNEKSNHKESTTAEVSKNLAGFGMEKKQALQPQVNNNQFLSSIQPPP